MTEGHSGSKKYDLAVIESKMTAIDISKIAEYSNKINQISGLSGAMAACYLKDFVVAYDLTSSLLSVAIKCELDADSAVKYYESVAYWDRASDFLKQKGVKDSDAARKKYVDFDEDVMNAKNLYNRAQATSQLIKNKLIMFRYAYEAIKKMYFGNDNNIPFTGIE